MHAKSVALKPYLLTTLASVSLILLLLKFTWGFWERWDLPLYDGAFYFASAYDFAYYGHFPDPQWSPGFIAYYAPFHLLFEQADLVYVAHRFSIHVILTLLTYFVLRRFSSSMIAWSLTALSLLTVNISMSYYGVHLFVLIPIWLLYAANGLKQITLRRVSIFAVFIVLIYVRPEFALGLSLLLIFWAVKMQQIIRKQTLNNVSSIRQIASLAIMASITLVVIWHTTSGARSMQAFTQHYGWGYSERYPDWEGGIDYWTQSADLINDQFDGASTVSSVVINNPAAFIEHALWNMQISPGVFLQTLTLQVGEIESFLRILFFACLFIVFVRMYYMSESWQQIMGNNQLQLAITIGILGSILVSAIIVRPRVLYLLR